jgi:UDP-N-acetyl-2-amino-2-deoxyglucuronate dehydrogenase
MIHIGLIGAGNISQTHADAASQIDDARVVAVCGRTRDRAERLAAHAEAAAYDDLGRFLDHRPMDLVVIGSPSGLHAAQGIAAAQQGLHVLSEKPIDTSTARADRLIAEAARVGVTLGVIFQDRMKPDIARVKALVDGGRLGTPILASASVRWHRPLDYYKGSTWRGTHALDGGGALINQGVHTVDLLLWLFGPVRRVFGKVATRLHAIEVEDTAVATLEFASGAIGTIEAATSAYPGYARQIALTGSEGTVKIDGDRLSAIDLRHALPSDAVAEAAAASVAASSPVVADVSAHRAVFEDFIAAIAHGVPPMCDGAQGRASIVVIEAIYQSSRSGQPVDIPMVNQVIG